MGYDIHWGAVLLQTSFITSQSNVGTSGITNMDINNLSQIGQAQLILPTDSGAFFSNGQQQFNEGNNLNNSDIIHKGAVN